MLTEETAARLEPHLSLNDWVHVKLRVGMMREIVAELRSIQSENAALRERAQKMEGAARELLEVTGEHRTGETYTEFSLRREVVRDALAAALEAGPRIEPPKEDK